MTIDGASLGVSAFILIALAAPWVRMRFRGPGTIQLASIHLNRRWGRLDREADSDRKTQAVNEVLRCIHQRGLNPIDPQLLEDIGAHLEAESQRASRVVPAAQTTWLIILTLAEALQFIAVPFAPVVGWDNSRLPKILQYGLPQHLHNNYDTMEIILWIVLSPMLALVFLASLASGLGLIAEVVKRVGGENTMAQNAFSKGVCLVVQFAVGLYIRVQELMQEFECLFMFAALLMPFFCPQCFPIKSGVSCWQESTHITFIALSLLQLLCQLGMVCWNNLLLYTLCCPCKHRSAARSPMGKIMEQCFQKDDHMTFSSQACLHDPAILADIDLMVLDFDRPMFSSTWSAFSGSLKLVLATCFVFFGQKDGCRWMLLGLAMLCYTVLLALNLFMAPCTVHWINCARNVSLVAGLWATLCGFAIAGGGTDCYVLVSLAVGLLIIAVVVLPAVMVYGFRSIEVYRGASAVLRDNLLNSFQRMVVLFRLLMVRVTPEGAIVGGGQRSGVYTIKGLEVASPSGTLFQGSLRRLRADAEDWMEWADWGALVCPAACCPCLPWIPLSLPGDSSVCDLRKGQRKENRKVEMSPHSLICTSTSKVEKWMESADLVVDPDRDVELGFCMPPDVRFTIGDGPLNSNGIGPHDLFYDASALGFKVGGKHKRHLSAALYRSSLCQQQPKASTSRSEDEGPSCGHLDARAVQTIERAYEKHEPQVPVPQTHDPEERPRSSAFDTGGPQ